MERYAKSAAIAAAVGSVFFLLIGLVSGTPILTALFRAIFSGLIVGAGTAGVIVVAGMLLPGLEPSGEAESAAPPAGTDEERGTRLDIVVEDEIEDVPDDATSVGEEVTEAVLDELPQDEVTNDDTLDEDEVAIDGGEDLVEEVREQTADDAESIMQAAIEEEQDGAGVVGSRSEVDDIPDIGAFAGSFVSSEYSENDEGTPGPTGAQHDSGNDPAQIARAIQTLLNRDEQS